MTSTRSHVFHTIFQPKNKLKTIPVSIYEYNQVPKQTCINGTTILFWFTRAKAEGYYTFNVISPYCSVFVFVAVKNIYSCNFVYIMAKPKTQFIQWGTNGYQKSNAMNKFVICMIYIPIFKRLHITVNITIFRGRCRKSVVFYVGPHTKVLRLSNNYFLV